MLPYRRLGSTDLVVPPIGLGTWGLSGTWWGPQDDSESIRVIHRSLAAGVTFFDTAEAYGDGHAEEILGTALRGRRPSTVIASKVSPEHLEPTALRASFEASCRRLNTDYLDIYFLHWPNSDVPIGPALAELEQLRAAGRIRAIGVSNFTVAELSEARQHATIDVLQPPYNMFWRQIEDGELEDCRRHGIGVVTYSGLAQGLLTGALTADTKLADGDMRAKTVMFRPPHYADCLRVVDQLRQIADRNGCTVADIAINWLASRDGISCALLGARTVAEADANIAALGVELPKADLALADACTREIWESLRHYPDMFASWERMEIQRRRYALANRLPR